MADILIITVVLWSMLGLIILGTWLEKGNLSDLPSCVQIISIVCIGGPLAWGLIGYLVSGEIYRRMKNLMDEENNITRFKTNKVHTVEIKIGNETVRYKAEDVNILLSSQGRVLCIKSD